MAINLKQLILVAPFPEDHKKQLIDNIDKLTDDQKYRLTSAAWKVLAQVYFSRLEAERELIMDEVVHDKRKFNPNDIEEVATKLIVELREKFQKEEENISLEDVRSELSKYQTKPLSSDKRSQPN